jgi:hypothetical protein
MVNRTLGEALASVRGFYLNAPGNGSKSEYWSFLELPNTQIAAIIERRTNARRSRTWVLHKGGGKFTRMTTVRRTGNSSGSLLRECRHERTVTQRILEATF